eukprot:4330338-Amphidinium_carterae.1
MRSQPLIFTSLKPTITWRCSTGTATSQGTNRLARLVCVVLIGRYEQEVQQWVTATANFLSGSNSKVQCAKHLSSIALLSTSSTSASPYRPCPSKSQGTSVRCLTGVSICCPCCREALSKTEGASGRMFLFGGESQAQCSTTHTFTMWLMLASALVLAVADDVHVPQIEVALVPPLQPEPKLSSGLETLEARREGTERSKMNEILHVFQTAKTAARKRLDSVITQDLQELVLQTWKWQSCQEASCSLCKYQRNESVAWTSVLRVAISRLQVAAKSCYDCYGVAGADDIGKDADLILPQ